jgi:N-acetylmuramoyl-L-alanine amidase
MAGGTYYTVSEDECISSVADKHGLFWKKLWECPENTALRKQRKNPNVLLAGDRVFVPDKAMREEPGATEQKHTFRRKGVPTYFRLRVMDEDEPQGDVRYFLKVAGKLLEGRTTTDGLIEEKIPANAREGQLVLGEGENAETYEIHFGRLDPVDHEEGVRRRLASLGFDCGDGDAEKLAAAIRAFQLKHELDLTGKLDDNTLRKLRAGYGC